MPPEIDATKRGWLGRKYYLSPEAIELLESHCKGTPLTMSAYLDLLIKQGLAPPSSPFPPRPKTGAPRDKTDDYESRVDAARQQPTKKDPDFDF